MTTIDLNSDMGEYESEAFLTLETQLMPLITSVNIACGGHAGHPHLMRRTVRLAAQHGTAIGAHPGFPDTNDFGRLDRQTRPDEVESLVTSQLKTLFEVLTSEDLTLTHVKPHGALYNLAAKIGPWQMPWHKLWHHSINVSCSSLPQDQPSLIAGNSLV